ncbi:peptidoglycan-binding domain-containing protein [Asticcacaulis sp. BYS171W]|uniref:Peptidoglycan-binding domain-containing protein n=1 Tax=Asticcacaulis aquaticus TaxID=2984212 RepID=A0ABT5HQF9_9CAUL|nr:peptidoglycan-binding domain-containing protein [Asticcacaulis aquaticus]MDC7682177.1 peptidoglycan-binding domain-containing protein [Asticcacaulis aquaticus]
MPALGSDKRLKVTTAAILAVAVAIIVWSASQTKAPKTPANAQPPEMVQAKAGKTPSSSATTARANRHTVLNIQKLLTRLGYDPGPANGVLSARTELAIAQFKVDGNGTFQVTDYEAILSALVSAVAAEPAK